jgi:hypothetical protein
LGRRRGLRPKSDKGKDIEKNRNHINEEVLPQGFLPIGDEKKGGILSKRAKSSLSRENFVLLPDLTLPPTTNRFW